MTVNYNSAVESNSPCAILRVALSALFIMAAIAITPVLSAPRLTIEKGVQFGNVECSGDLDRFLSENKTINGLKLKEGSAMLQTLKASVSGNFTDKLSIEGKFDDTLYPSKRELSIRYLNRDLSLTAGDIRAGFQGADLAIQTRTLFGARITAQGPQGTSLEGHSVSGFIAQLTTKQRTDEFMGDNTVGPFFLSQYPVLENSEQVQVDRELKYQFTDYEINYENGTILFKNPVEQGKVIRVVYEHDREFGITKNRLWGARATGRSNAIGRFGITAAGLDEQKSLGTSVVDLGHKVVGVDLDLGRRPFGRLRMEAARSDDERNDLDQDGIPDRLTGNALKLNYSFQNWQFGIKGKAERYDAGFRTLGEGTSDSDRSLVDLKTTFSRSKDLEFGLDLRRSQNNLDHDPEKSTSVLDRLESRVMRKGTIKGKGYELTLTGRREKTDGTAAVSLALNPQATGIKTQVTEDLVSADFKVRLRGALAGLKLETRNRNRETTDSSATVNDSRTHAGEISVTARIAKPLIMGISFRADRDENPGYVSGDGSNLTTTFSLDGKTSEKFRARAQVSVKDIDGVQGGRDTSSSLTLTAGQRRGLSADATYEVKRSCPDGGDVTGTSVFEAGVNYIPEDRVELRTFYEMRGVDGLTTQDRTEYGVKLTTRPRKNLTLKGEIRRSRLLDFEVPEDGYSARTAYVEASVSF